MRGPPKKIVTLHGKPVTIGDLAELAGVSLMTMYKRLETSSPEKAVAMKKVVYGEDLTGRTFNDGQLTVLRKAGKNPSGKQMFTCRCKCGNVKDIVGADLKSGQAKSCGCRIGTTASERALARAEDIAGREFADGAVTVIGPSANWYTKSRTDDSRMGRLWLCRCECGNKFESPAHMLKSGQTTSCGCGITRNRKRTGTGKKHEFMGELLTISEIEELSGRSRQTILNRTGRGMTIEEAALGPMRPSPKRTPQQENHDQSYADNRHLPRVLSDRDIIIQSRRSVRARERSPASDNRPL